MSHGNILESSVDFFNIYSPVHPSIVCLFIVPHKPQGTYLNLCIYMHTIRKRLEKEFD